MLQETSQQVLLDSVQLASLLQRLKLAAEPQAALEQRARVGSYVTLTSPDFKESLEIKLVEPCESYPSRNKVSYLSPLGSAILGLRQGAEVNLAGYEDRYQWIIADVCQHAGDF